MRIEIGTTESRAYLGIQPPPNAEQRKLISSELGVDENVFIVHSTPAGQASETALPYTDRQEGVQQIRDIARQIADVLSGSGFEVEVDETVHDLRNGGRLFANTEKPTQ